jgi:hypothetical protein
VVDISQQWDQNCDYLIKTDDFIQWEKAHGAIPPGVKLNLTINIYYQNMGSKIVLRDILFYFCEIYVSNKTLFRPIYSALINPELLFLIG